MDLILMLVIGIMVCVILKLILFGKHTDIKVTQDEAKKNLRQASEKFQKVLKEHDITEEELLKEFEESRKNRE